MPRTVPILVPLHHRSTVSGLLNAALISLIPAAPAFVCSYPWECGQVIFPGTPLPLSDRAAEADYSIGSRLDATFGP